MRAKEGFTLAELLISISIVIVFMAVLLPSISRFGRRNELRLGAQLVQSKIYEAKGYALAPRSGDSSSPIVQYQFIAPVSDPIDGCSQTDEEVYAIVEKTADDLINDEPGTAIECLPLPNGQSFTNDSDQDVTFCVAFFEQESTIYCPGGNAVIEPPTGGKISFTIVHPRLTEPDNTRKIDVYRVTGQVTIQ